MSENNDIKNKKEKELFYSKSNKRQIEKAKKEVEKGNVVVKTIEDLETMI